MYMYVYLCIYVFIHIGWLVVLRYSVPTLFGSFNQILNHSVTISIFFVCKQLNVKTVLFQIIQISKVYSLVLFQTVQFSLSTKFKCQKSNTGTFHFVLIFSHI